MEDYIRTETDYIREATDELISKKQKKMKKIRITLTIIIVVCVIFALYFHYLLGIPFGILMIGLIWYLIPRNVHIYPEDIQLKLQQRLHQLEDEEKKLGLNSQLLIEEQEIKNSLYTLTHKEEVFEE